MWEWLASIFGGDKGGGGGGNQGSGHFGSGLDQTAQASQAGQAAQMQLGSLLTPVQQGGLDMSSGDSNSQIKQLLQALMSRKGAAANARAGEDVREQVLGDLYGKNELNRMQQQQF